MKYLKLFENHTAYEAAESGLILPNVSYCVNENEVHYKPYDPYNGHEYIDLGLPSGTKWATMNVGANSVTDYGNYYIYGKGSATYQETSGDSTYNGTENPLATSADTAAQVWGGSWHMPTQAQFNELLANTTYEWVTDYQGSGINGGTFTANGQTLFIPAGGSYYFGSISYLGSYCYMWSSTPNGSSNAYYLNFNKNVGTINYNYRAYGYSIRPVAD